MSWLPSPAVYVEATAMQAHREGRALAPSTTVRIVRRRSRKLYVRALQADGTPCERRLKQSSERAVFAFGDEGSYGTAKATEEQRCADQDLWGGAGKRRRPAPTKNPRTGRLPALRLGEPRSRAAGEIATFGAASCASGGRMQELEPCPKAIPYIARLESFRLA